MSVKIFLPERNGIKENADISQVKVASRLEMSTKTIERDIEVLVQAGGVKKIRTKIRRYRFVHWARRMPGH